DLALAGDELAIVADLHETARRDFAPVQPERDLVIAVAARHPQGEVIEDALVKPVHHREPVRGGEIHPRLPSRRVDVAGLGPIGLQAHRRSPWLIRATASAPRRASSIPSSSGRILEATPSLTCTRAGLNPRLRMAIMHSAYPSRSRRAVLAGSRKKVMVKFEAKKLLVTGGAGFLGSHLCERLLARGHDVLCVDNFFTGGKGNIEHLLKHPRFELMRHDITFPLYVEVDEIYNLACPASPVHYQFDPVQTTKTSVHGAINVLGLAKRVKAKILQASTSEVYGDPEVHPQPEDYWGRVNPVGLRSCYDEGK